MTESTRTQDDSRRTIIVHSERGHAEFTTSFLLSIVWGDRDALEESVAFALGEVSARPRSRHVLEDRMDEIVRAQCEVPVEHIRVDAVHTCVGEGHSIVDAVADLLQLLLAESLADARLTLPQGLLDIGVIQVGDKDGRVSDADGQGASSDSVGLGTGSDKVGQDTGSERAGSEGDRQSSAHEQDEAEESEEALHREESFHGDDLVGSELRTSMERRKGV